jgi:hypothetical protein
MNHVAQPGDRAGECLLLWIEVDCAGGISFVFHHGFTEKHSSGTSTIIMRHLRHG